MNGSGLYRDGSKLVETAQLRERITFEPSYFIFSKKLKNGMSERLGQFAMDLTQFTIIGRN